MLEVRGDHFWFGSVFIKKSNQTEFFFKKTKTEIVSNRPVSVRFFRTKAGSNRFDLVFLLVFFVQFGFFGFRLIKTKPN
jgi:hypothetical protein